MEMTYPCGASAVGEGEIPRACSVHGVDCFRDELVGKLQDTFADAGNAVAMVARFEAAVNARHQQEIAMLTRANVTNLREMVGMAGRHRDTLRVVRERIRDLLALLPADLRPVLAYRYADATLARIGRQRRRRMAQRDDAQAACHEWSAIVKQCDLDATTLRAELDAAQQERDSIATQLHAEIASERERRVAAQEAIALKYVPELEAARQQITTLTEALDVAAQDIRDWVKTARGLRDRVADPDHDPSTPHLRGIAESEQVLTRIYAALSSPPRPQEPQPAEPKSSETRKPVVNLMEALKKSLDSLNANRTSQEPGGHQP